MFAFERNDDRTGENLTNGSFNVAEATMFGVDSAVIVPTGGGIPVGSHWLLPTVVSQGCLTTWKEQSGCFASDVFAGESGMYFLHALAMSNGRKLEWWIEVDFENLK